MKKKPSPPKLVTDETISDFLLKSIAFEPLSIVQIHHLLLPLTGQTGQDPSRKYWIALKNAEYVQLHNVGTPNLGLAITPKGLSFIAQGGYSKDMTVKSMSDSNIAMDFFTKRAWIIGSCFSFAYSFTDICLNFFGYQLLPVIVDTLKGLFPNLIN